MHLHLKWLFVFIGNSVHIYIASVKCIEGPNEFYCHVQHIAIENAFERSLKFVSFLFYFLLHILIYVFRGYSNRMRLKCGIQTRNQNQKPFQLKKKNKYKKKWMSHQGSRKKNHRNCRSMLPESDAIDGITFFQKMPSYSILITNNITNCVTLFSCTNLSEDEFWDKIGKIWRNFALAQAFNFPKPTLIICLANGKMTNQITFLSIFEKQTPFSVLCS